jgi:uncharacterized membrane protein
LTEQSTYLEKLLTERIVGVENSIKVAHDDLVRVPTEVQKQIAALKELLLSKLEDEHYLKEEKFKTVFQRFELNENSRIEQKQDLSQTIANTLTAAKEISALQNQFFSETISKSDTATTKQIDALKEQIEDIKNRFLRSEGKVEGTEKGGKNTWGIVASVIGIILLILYLVNLFMKVTGKLT